MLGYATVGATDLNASLAFYTAVFKPLGVVQKFATDSFVGFGPEGSEHIQFWIACPPYNREPAVAGNGIMIGLSAPNRASVRAFHAAALAHGGTCEGEPGLRQAYGPNIYLAYVRDPVGNKLSALCTQAEEA